MNSLAESLKFIKGAVKESDLIPIMGSVVIKNGMASAYNGELRLTSSIPLDLEGTPSATTFLKALNRLGDVESITAEEGHWLVKSGRTKVKVKLLPEEEFEMAMPEGEIERIEGPTGRELLQACKHLAPLISKDASRPWSQTLRFHKGMAAVTNNVILIEYWLDFPLPDLDLCLPVAAVNELVRIGEPPTHIQATDNFATFHWREDNRFLLTHLMKVEWPNLDPVFEKGSWGIKPLTLVGEFWEGLEQCVAFSEKPMHKTTWEGNVLSTPEVEVTLPEDLVATSKVCFNAAHALKLRSLMEGETAFVKTFMAYRAPLARAIAATFQQA